MQPPALALLGEEPPRQRLRRSPPSLPLGALLTSALTSVPLMGTLVSRHLQHQQTDHGRVVGVDLQVVGILPDHLEVPTFLKPPQDGPLPGRLDHERRRVCASNVDIHINTPFSGPQTGKVLAYTYTST